MKIIDLKKTLKPLYVAKSKKIVYVDVPELQYLMIDGVGAPRRSKQSNFFRKESPPMTAHLSASIMRTT